MAESALYTADRAHPRVEGEIIRALVGSTLHGTGLDGGEDRDEMGVMLEHPRFVTGIDHFEQYQYRTAEAARKWRPGSPKQPRSEPGDLDLTVFSARKYLQLTCQGNPSMLLLLFVPSHLLVFKTEWGTYLQNLSQHVVSKQAGPRFLGYMKAQRERLEGVRGGRHTNRPELESIHGFDTKYAMHMVRLGFQGIELIQTGRITLPMPKEEGDFCRAIRTGSLPKEDALRKAAELEVTLNRLIAASPLQEKPNVDRVNAWLYEAYETAWDDAHPWGIAWSREGRERRTPSPSRHVDPDQAG